MNTGAEDHDEAPACSQTGGTGVTCPKLHVHQRVNDDGQECIGERVSALLPMNSLEQDGGNMSPLIGCFSRDLIYVWSSCFSVSPEVYLTSLTHTSRTGLISRIIGVNSHSHISQHRLWTGGGH